MEENIIIHTQPEDQLLLCCSRFKLDKENFDKIRKIISSVDWDIFLHKAIFHKVIPLVFLNIKRCCREKIPRPIWKRLKEFYIANGVRNLFLVYNLIEILDLFKDNNIKAVPFKGPVLALSVYHSYSFRSFVDLDILIESSELNSAIGLLKAHGYSPDINLTDSQYNKFTKIEDNLSLSNQEMMTTVELHWELSGCCLPQPFDYKMIESRLDSILLKNRIVRTLGGEDLLIYLCVHGSKHKWNCLDFVCCVAELVRERPNLDWDQIFEFSKDIGAKRMVLVGLKLAKDILDIKIPTAAGEMMAADPKVERLASHVRELLLLQGDDEQQHLFSTRFAFWHLHCVDTFENSIRYALRLSFVPTIADWRWVRLPAQVSFLYYCLRPVRLSFEFFKSILCN